MLATLLLSRGVPMLLGGDELRRSQGGNNNAYCQDNEVSWYDWRLVERNGEVLRFVRELIAFRRRHPVLHTDAFYTGDEIEWFGPEGRPPDWDGPTRALGCLVRNERPAGALCLLFNAGETPVEFRLHGAQRRVAIDTGNPAPNDIYASEDRPTLRDPARYRLVPRALAVLSSA